ncbi:DUF7344 domain-containing protein [Haloarcula onubensis]|uniref:DUF7344 domain-containing protein n=1 Tax=Haloarcula onubensis TaxID=2950539 RepID=A0ABU2FTU8_9EURY|nr:hypothetical protein [Halomicroarcula sp. S3CR25-11]MDS0284199.1 hypothetical protein [Halomicroarcula sp. S3CR25-11]
MAPQNADTEMGDGLPPAVVEDLLSDDARRRALAILSDREGPVVVEELAAAVVAAREGCGEAAIEATDQETMAEELFTEHLPKLMATDVVAYDSMLGTVELRRRDVAPQRQP